MRYGLGKRTAMSADSFPRRIAKRLLAPVLNETTYEALQAVAMAYDIWSGGWQEPELDLIDYAVRQGETAIDIGANYGLYSYHLSRAVGRSGYVYAFEPIPYTADVFRKVSRLLRLGNVQLTQMACGEKNGSLTFNVPIHESGAIIAGIVHLAARNNDRPGKEQHARFQRIREVSCQVIRIDDCLSDLKEVSFLKCDIEGADLLALRGASALLAKHRPLVVCEINPWFLEGYGFCVNDVVGFFSKLDYQLYRYVGQRLIAKSADDVEEDNWIFVHPSRLDRVRELVERNGAPRSLRAA